MFIIYIYKIKRPELRMNERSSLGLPPHWVHRWQDSFPHVCTFGRAAPLIGSFVVCGNHSTPPVYWASSVFRRQNLKKNPKGTVNQNRDMSATIKEMKVNRVPSGFHAFSLSNMSRRCDDDQGERFLFFLWQQAFPFYSRTVLNWIYCKISPLTLIVLTGGDWDSVLGGCARKRLQVGGSTLLYPSLCWNKTEKINTKSQW